MDEPASVQPLAVAQCSMLLFLLLLPGILFGQQAPVLDVPTIGSPGAIQLSLHGQAGTNYVLEASRSLNSWLPLSSVLATNSQVLFQYSPGTNPGALYFRARVDIKLPPITVSVQTDTNAQTVALLSQHDGGSMSLMDQNGIIYTVMIPPQAVADSQVVTMSVVESIGGLPFAAGLSGGVSFTPEGIVLAQPAQLLIQFPTNPPIDLRKLATYGFAADGTQFHLTPSVPITNGFMVPLTTLTGVGCSMATFQEIIQQGRRLVSDATSNGVPVKPGHTIKGAYYDSCYPAEKTRAVFAGKGMENAANAARQAEGEKIDANSQLPESEQLSPLQLNLEEDFNNFYKEVTDPYAAEIQTNCSLFGKASIYILGASRQSELMGLSVPPPASFDVCSVFTECARKIDECCKIRGASQEAMIEVLGLSRQRALLGCSESTLFEECPDCFPIWYGTVTYDDSYSNYEQTGPDSEVDWQYHFTSTMVGPTNLAGNPTGKGYYSVTGTLLGSADGEDRVHTLQSNPDDCGSYVDTLKTSAISTGDALATFQLVWAVTNTPPGPQNGLLLFPNPATLSELVSVQALLTETDATATKDKDGNCIQALKVSTTNATDTYRMQQIFYNSPTITGTVNDVTGTFTTNWVSSDGAQWKRVISWDIHRQQGP